MKLSDVLHSDVVCKSDSSLVGKVENVYFDENCKKIVYFDVSCADARRLLPFSAAAALSDAVMTDDTLALHSHGDADISALVSSPIGKKIYTGTGKFKGEISDVSFSAKGKVSSLNTEETAYSPSSFRAFGDVWLLKDAASGRKTPRVPFPKAEEDYKVSILDASAEPDSSATSVLKKEKNTDGIFAVDPDDSQSEKTVSAGVVIAQIPVAEENRVIPLDVRAAESENETHVYLRDAAGGRPEVIFNDEGFTPYRVIADYNFLLGRRLTDDLFAYSGEKLASKGAQVNVDMVETARRHGKLMELTLSSR